LELLGHRSITPSAHELLQVDHVATADLAIATYRSTDKGSYDGHDLSGQYRWLDVFAKRNGTWQFIVSQGTKIEQPKKP
jgi:hypothetical protein